MPSETFICDREKPLPERILFQYPHPKILGLILDPTEKATVKEVKPASIAAKSGFQPGDEILMLAGQPLLSIADIQWILHRAESQDELTAEIKRDGNIQQLTLALPSGWKRADDLSWRVSSWPMRRMVLGGAILEEDNSGRTNGSRSACKCIDGTANSGSGQIWSACHRPATGLSGGRYHHRL